MAFFQNDFVQVARGYYSPELGRFISPDPVLAGLNRYAYCHNNPINYVDPTGFDPESYGDYFGYDASNFNNPDYSGPPGGGTSGNGGGDPGNGGGGSDRLDQLLSLDRPLTRSEYIELCRLILLDSPVGITGTPVTPPPAPHRGDGNNPDPTGSENNGPDGGRITQNGYPDSYNRLVFDPGALIPPVRLHLPPPGMVDDPLVEYMKDLAERDNAPLKWIDPAEDPRNDPRGKAKSDLRVYPDKQRLHNFLLVSHYTSKNRALNILKEGVIRPSKWETNVFVMLEPSTKKQAAAAGAKLTEVRVVFSVDIHEIVKDPGTPVANAFMFYYSGPIYISTRSPLIIDTK